MSFRLIILIRGLVPRPTCTAVCISALSAERPLIALCIVHFAHKHSKHIYGSSRYHLNWPIEHTGMAVTRPELNQRTTARLMSTMLQAPAAHHRISTICGLRDDNSKLGPQPVVTSNPANSPSTHHLSSTCPKLPIPSPHGAPLALFIRSC